MLPVLTSITTVQMLHEFTNIITAVDGVCVHQDYYCCRDSSATSFDSEVDFAYVNRITTIFDAASIDYYYLC